MAIKVPYLGYLSKLNQDTTYKRNDSHSFTTSHILVINNQNATIRLVISCSVRE